MIPSTIQELESKLIPFNSTQHSHKLFEYLSERNNIQMICHPLWLENGNYYILEQDNILLLIKKAKAYGHKLLYAICSPLSYTNSHKEEIIALQQYNKLIEFQLTSYHTTQFNITNIPTLVQHKEFYYHLDKYTLQGRPGLKTRKAINYLNNNNYTIKIFSDKDNIPFYIKAQLTSILNQWKEDRGSEIAQYKDLFIKSLDNLFNPIITLIYDRFNKPISYSIADYIPELNTIFYLDEKSLRIPLLHNTSKVLIAKTIESFLSKYNNPQTTMTIGAGSRRYKINDHQYDLTRHKANLSPTLITNAYKFKVGEIK